MDLDESLAVPAGVRGTVFDDDSVHELVANELLLPHAVARDRTYLCVLLGNRAYAQFRRS
eukprot:747421-Hanusia_phi.AAC.8